MGSRFIFDKTKGQQIFLPCNRCSIYTKHDVLSSVDESGSEVIEKMRGFEISWWGEYQIIQCRGCETISFRRTEGNSENIDEGDQIDLYPARISGRRELEKAHLLPYKVGEIYAETYKAACNNMPVLAAIGIRALVESVCRDKGAKSDNLVGKINELIEFGVLTSDGATILHNARFLGNDAAHQVIKPDEDILSAALDVAEHLLRNVYILPESATRLNKKKARVVH